MTSSRGPARLRRLAEELAETGINVGIDLGDDDSWPAFVLEEIDRALRPPVHERRVASSGAILGPSTDPSTWSAATNLAVVRRPVGRMPLTGARRFADGLSSWLIRRMDGVDEWAIFDRPAGSERDLVVLAGAFGATLVQRHPTGVVRLVGSFGVLRWVGFAWQHEPPVSTWLDSVSACPISGDPAVVEALLEFAVHDLGARGIGATLVYRPVDDEAARFELRLPPPPPLDIRRPTELAPLRHALRQVDGAAVFDRDGVLRQLGVRLVPSPEAESMVEGFRGMRHTSGRRYSSDDPASTVVVVSEDGPVSVLRAGKLLGRSPSPEKTEEPDLE